MYNHYIPQSDGSYRRSTMPEGSRRNPQPQGHPAPPPPPKPPKPPEPPCAPEPPRPVPCPPPPPPSGGSILDFLRGLLPRQIDATDLLVILLLLLMNRDENGEGLSPMLTIALYFLL